MKHRGERPGRWGEGWLVAAALGLALALSFAVYVAWIPARVTALPVHAVSHERLRRVEMVNINEAAAEELAGLPGVGEVIAERIVAYRQAHGSFTSVDELMRVEGIGDAKLQAMRGRVYIE